MCGRRTGTRKLPGRTSTCRKSTIVGRQQLELLDDGARAHGLTGH